MTYEEWEKTVPAQIVGDTGWKIEAYRLSLFLVDLAWHDAAKLKHDPRTAAHCSQLYRALGSISANLSEGYSRATGRERARFYEFSLGSARESRDWYYQSRHILGKSVTDHRMDLTTQIIRLFLAMIPNQRRNNFKLNTTTSKSLSRNHVIA